MYIPSNPATKKKNERGRIQAGCVFSYHFLVQSLLDGSEILFSPSNNLSLSWVPCDCIDR